MKTVTESSRKRETASALVAALSTILVLSIVAAGVLMNSATRYNTTSSQVKGWKDALFAAEAGGDLAFAVIRKTITDPAALNTASGWSAPAPSPLPATNSWALGHNGTPVSFGTNGTLSTKVTVDRLGDLPGNPDAGYYRIRSTGNARVMGLKRTGMDNRMNATTKGDNLLRRIDFQFDRFLTTYGFGDALPSAIPSSANGKPVEPEPVAHPQVTRRVELIATPIMPIEGAIKTAGAFRGTTVDSYNSANPPNPTITLPNLPSSYYGNNPTGSYLPYAIDARDGDVVVGNNDFSTGMIYGDVSTNGGNARPNQATGVVDNNVPIVLPPAVPGIAPLPLMPGMFGGPATEGNPDDDDPIDPPRRTWADGQMKTEFWYSVGSFDEDLKLNPLRTTATTTLADGTVVPVNTRIETTINLYATGDVDGITVNRGTKANVYFRGNMEGKVRDYINQNWDGAAGSASLPATERIYRYVVDRPATNTAATSGNQTVDGSNVLNSTSANFSLADLGKPIGGPGIPAGTTIAAVTSPTKVVLSRTATATQADGNVVIGTFTPSARTSRADHLWFYGISPPAGTTRRIALGSGMPAVMWAAFYAPGHNFSVEGNPDIYGVGVFKEYYENGNCTWHFDKQLLNGGRPLDYRIASYVEDIR